MFSNYNKNNAKGTLVGNWVEEEALRSVTGFSRRLAPGPNKAPASPESAAGSRSPRATECTHNRTLLHANENGRTTYETTVQASTRYGDGVLRVALGPRSSLREAQVIEAARQLHERELAAKHESHQRQFEAARSTTTAKAAFTAPETGPLGSAPRVPRGRNGARVVDTSVAHLTRGEVDSLDRAKLSVFTQQQQQSGSTAHGVAVTRYSHALATGVGLDFGTTTSDATNPFGRSSAFTNDIHDPTKHHGEAMDPGSALDERLGMTVHQRSALQRLLAACKQTPSLWDRLRNELTARAEPATSSGVVELPAFRSQVAAAKLLSERDAIHTFMHFDPSHIGAIRLDDFFAFCDAQLLTPTL